MKIKSHDKKGHPSSSVDCTKQVLIGWAQARWGSDQWTWLGLPPLLLSGASTQVENRQTLRPLRTVGSPQLHYNQLPSGVPSSTLSLFQFPTSLVKDSSRDEVTEQVHIFQLFWNWIFAQFMLMCRWANFHRVSHKTTFWTRWYFLQWVQRWLNHQERRSRTKTGQHYTTGFQIRPQYSTFESTLLHPCPSLPLLYPMNQSTKSSKHWAGREITKKVQFNSSPLQWLGC